MVGLLCVLSFWMRDVKIKLLCRSPVGALVGSVQTSYKLFLSR